MPQIIPLLTVTLLHMWYEEFHSYVRGPCALWHLCKLAHVDKIASLENTSSLIGRGPIHSNWTQSINLGSFDGIFKDISYQLQLQS